MKDVTGETPSIDLAGADLSAVGERLPVPGYDRSAVARSIVHIGVGGFHRAHLAVYVDELCRQGHTGWSIVGSGVTPFDGAMAEALGAQDGLYTLVERGRTGTSARVIGSIVDYVLASERPGDLVDRLASPEVAIASMTITEGGYPVDDLSGEFLPESDSLAFEILTEALARRRADGVGPLTVVSCDNVIGNGHTARTSTIGTAALRDPDLAGWIESEVAFPNSMVDRITPVTTDADRRWLAETHGVVDRWPVVTEPFCQWVIEDEFVGGRPPFDDVGVLVASDVVPYEVLKLRLLNASHSCLAYLSALAGIKLVDQAMASDPIRSFVDRFLRTEAIPVLPDVPGIDVEEYADQLVERFSNPAIGDQISRLCLDGSSKFPKFLLPTVRAQLESGGSIRHAALALAGWCRYLQGQDDSGGTIDLSFDPRLEEVAGLAAEPDPRAFLAYSPVFGEDLVADERFVGAFTDSLRSLREVGVLSALDTALS
jgi:mannitol 2-dehydrogenase